MGKEERTVSEEERPSLHAAKRILEPWARIWNREIGSLIDAEDREVAILRHVASLMTTTNCGWDTYAVAQIMLREIDAEQSRRAYARSRAALSPPKGS